LSGRQYEQQPKRADSPGELVHLQRDTNNQVGNARCDAVGPFHFAKGFEEFCPDALQVLRFQGAEHVVFAASCRHQKFLGIFWKWFSRTTADTGKIDVKIQTALVAMVQSPERFETIGDKSAASAGNATRHLIF
jgi:hypothetical protein